MKCEDCTEWEYFEGYGYGCVGMKTMTPIDANKCEFYADKDPMCRTHGNHQRLSHKKGAIRNVNCYKTFSR